MCGIVIIFKKILFNSSLLLDLDSFLQQANTINCPKQWLASLVIKLYNFCRNGHFPVQRRFACFSSCSCSRAETLGKSGTALFVSYTLPLTKPTAEKHWKNSKQWFTSRVYYPLVPSFIIYYQTPEERGIAQSMPAI